MKVVKVNLVLEVKIISSNELNIYISTLLYINRLLISNFGIIYSLYLVGTNNMLLLLCGCFCSSCSRWEHGEWKARVH